MLRDLNLDQLALADFMSQLSELSFSAKWMDKLEFDLWTSIQNGDRLQYGRHIITKAQLDGLKHLSDKCECWIYFDESLEETAISLNAWKKMYEDYQSLQ